MSAHRRRASFLIHGIGRLYTLRSADSSGPLRRSALRDHEIVEGGAVAAYEGRIVAAGEEAAVRSEIELLPGASLLDADGRAVTPGFVDPHTHAVFSEPRSWEFGRRLTGESYVEIAKAGGGIRASVREFREVDEQLLLEKTRQRLRDMLHMGTTTVEIKSGYGLALDSELKALRVIDAMRREPHLPSIVSTCLAAHEVPDEYRDDREGFLQLVCETILPAVAKEKLAERVDVFCEPHVFGVDESKRVVERGRELGMRATIHADEIEPSGGAELAAEVGADSADHLGRISDEGIRALAESDTVAVLLPATIFSLGLRNWAPARAMIEAGVAVALASDFNPGSNYCESIPLTMAIACTRMGLHPHEALAMATRNAACALRRHEEVGSLEPGHRADLLLLRGDSIDRLCHHLGQDEIDRVILAGESVFERHR